MNKNNRYSSLEQNLESNIQESLVKLGYYENEQIGIYYDKGLLCHLLNCTEQELVDQLKAFKTYISDKWGAFSILSSNERYKFVTSAQGVKHVFEKNKDNSFLKDFIKVIQDKESTIEDILNVFYKQSPDVICDKSENEEFQYVIYYANPEIDGFRYCISIDEMGKYYHRLTEYDFNNL